MFDKIEKKGGEMFDKIEKKGKHVETTFWKTVAFLTFTVAAFWLLKLTLWDHFLFARPAGPTELGSIFLVAVVCHAYASKDKKLLRWERLDTWRRRIARTLEVLLSVIGGFWFLKLAFIERTLFRQPEWAELLPVFVIASFCLSLVEKEEKE